MKTSLTTKALCVAGLLSAGAVAIAGVEMWQNTYDPARPLNPLSAVKVTQSDLATASLCAGETMGPQIRHGLTPSRSDLFYLEWKCRLASKKIA